MGREGGFEGGREGGRGGRERGNEGGGRGGREEGRKGRRDGGRDVPHKSQVPHKYTPGAGVQTSFVHSSIKFAVTRLKK